ncbi:hypothetical protein RchiOBHm_Chr5g0064601 [Rosa chinensis]|uniref:Uncharacterized protein n=1 Tax=Rosa chinensis TaxID=74649 RepID=A0A2P6QIR0_ROSCH|nr:hypothetical protein RchiOBHm_Chr5g0064601 [Rosa chinensis]
MLSFFWTESDTLIFCGNELCEGKMLQHQLFRPLVTFLYAQNLGKLGCSFRRK